MNRPLQTRRARSALLLTTLVLAMLILWLASAPIVTVGVDFYHSLRLYGYDSEGAGDTAVRDPLTSAVPEDPPYTDDMAVFNPQRPQAPRRDSLTWNPIWMSEAETRDENGAQGLYSGINTGDINATEKVWVRMWYEPEHWDKDLNASGALDRDFDGQPTAPVNPTPNSIDEWYPAIMQEFTYLLMEGKPLSQKPEPTYGPAGDTSFVFPVGVRGADLNNPAGYGLTSLDANFDGLSDIVYIESELTLFDRTQIAADFDGDGLIDPLDTDGDALSGDELAVLRLDGLSIPVDGKLQFLEHYVVLKAVYDASVLVEIWYNGSLLPRKLDSMVLYLGDMALAGIQGPGQVIQAVQNGGTGTNLCTFPSGPFFVQLISVDPAEDTARLMLGRAVGAAHSAMEDGANNLDRRPGDPWFLKRFYVDGHEYNVVAIKTAGSGPTFDDPNCDLDDNNDKVLDDYPPPDDPSQFQFITVRTPIPKVPVIIEQHSVALQDYPPPPAPPPYRQSVALSVMPPYNYEHFIILDVQKITSFSDAQFLGKLVGPVPPILQANGPIPYYGVGPYSPYSNLKEMTLFCIDEDHYDPFLGKLRERYAAGVPEGSELEREFWYFRHWWTRAWHYTEFVLPDIRPEITGADTPDLYLVASGYYAPQAQYYHSYQGRDEPRRATGGRVKFWFDPSGPNNLYVSEAGLRLYGRDRLGPGDLTVITDPLTTTYPVEVLPYTDTWAPFDPLLPQAPRKDVLTLDPAYMNEFDHGGEPISVLYGQIGVETEDAREKVFPRMWYEPEYLDKILRAQVSGTVITATEVYTFPALMQEFTYMLLDIRDQPTHGQPGVTRFVFPMATSATQLPAPVSGTLPSAYLPSFGYGLNSFDANFDGTLETVMVHSERSLYWETGVLADFDGDGDPAPPNPPAELDQLDTDGDQLSGDELVVFTVDVTLYKGQSAQFLDHLVSLENVSPGPWGTSIADLEFWYAGGGINPWGSGYSIHPQKIETSSLQRGDMAIVKRNKVRRIAGGSYNLGSVDGAWFAYVSAINTINESVHLIIGRALGATHSAIDNGAGLHDELPGDPWYLKRFFVDGHEYNVVALKTVPNETPGNGEDYEFKYITIRTPVPKPDDFVNYQDSLVLQGYLQGTVFGVDTSFASVMPPFNVSHTLAADIVTIPEEEFADPDPDDCQVQVLTGQGPLVVELTAEDKEPRFFGELKEKLWTGVVDCGMVINEVLYDEELDEPGNECLELYNSGPAPIDVGNYCLSDQDGLVYCLPSFVVQPDEYVRICSGTGTDQTTTSPYQLFMNQPAPVWDDDGDEVLLYMESGETPGYQAGEDVAVDFVEYEDGGGSGTGVPDGFYWVEDSPSPSNGGVVGTSISLYPNGACSDLSSSWHQSGTGNTVGPNSLGANNNAVDPPPPGPDGWSTEQFHTWPDQYTQIRLGQCRRGLITIDWTSDLSRSYYRGCDPQFDTQNELHGLNPAIPGTNEDGYFQADPTQRIRLEFVYDPCSPDDPYNNDEPLIPTVVQLSGFGVRGRPTPLAYWVAGGLALIGVILGVLGWRRRVA